MSQESNDNDRTESFTPLTKGTEVGHYKIIEKIGAGGMGEVYLANDTELKREVALKFLPANMCQDEDCRNRFKREAQATAKLNHPNIVTIFEVSEFKNRPFFAMECCDGKPLRDIIKEIELSIDDIIKLAIQLCEGLEKAHQAGIVHRDIKPSNIIVDSDGRAKLLDFGLATIQGTEKLTQTGSTLGTIGYMSPEQVNGENINATSDLFSLGVILYEMVTGQRPFQAEYDAAIMNAILHDTPEPLSRYKSNVPEQLQQIVTKLLEKNQSYRYQSAAGVLADLRRLSSKSLQPVKQIDKWNRYVVPSALVILLAIFATWKFGFQDQASINVDYKKIKLAVLPFENLGNPDDEYFADGITDEIISRLASLQELGVISRTSSLQYKKTTKNLRQIGDELGVDVILEGTIRWDKLEGQGRVRINAQLIRVKDDIHLWAERYDAVINNIFSVQSTIAGKVAEELGITLLESEQIILSQQPAISIEAYDHYLHAIEYLYKPPNKENIIKAITYFNNAIDLEPDFTDAYIWLSFAHGQMILFGYDNSNGHRNEAKKAIDIAFKISPDNPETHGALGWYYYQCTRDFDKALEKFELLLKNRPSDASAYMGTAAIKRVQGDWESSAKNWQKAVELDPLAARVSFEYAHTLLYLRQYDKAELFYDRAIKLSPDWQVLYFDKCWLYLVWKGETEAARRILNHAKNFVEGWPQNTVTEIELDIFDGNYDMALSKLSGTESIINIFDDSAQYYNFKGDLYRYLKQTEEMIACYDSARVLLESIIHIEPNDPYYHARLGLAYAGIGRKQDALREVETALEIMPLSKNAVRGSKVIVFYIKILIQTNEYEQALKHLELLLSIPAEISIELIQILPDYAPLYNYPGFQALIEKYENKDNY